MRTFVLGAAAAAALLCATGAGAETLPVTGVYPAQNDAAAALRTIAMDPFGGSDGQALAIAVSDRLRAVEIGGRPYFQLVPARSHAPAEGVLQGTATAELTRRDAEPREQESCVERDADDKCTKKEKVKIPCWNAVARLTPAVRLIDAEGRQLYALDEPQEQAKRYCKGEGRPSGEGLVRTLVARVADRVRADLAPFERSDDFRVMESRKGLASADSDAFKNAVRLTKSDRAAACTAWAGLEPANPGHASVLFDIGLCAESAGRIEDAAKYYRRALAADASADYAKDGLARLADRTRAAAQLASHGEA